ncbi:helix-turn-helix domain-containing protein [Campylobacter fetus]|uniref:XRE family transcriptional regulator n=1 Tax=Campylobacter fetus subsp. testudinum TaxID=1507806 RepID=A0AAX0HB73_CAMFE|nr:helix-turn-helix transcriptional regulator [Campylobacter fetus]AGZ81199.1 transcriptional regulator, XRE family [Campylobacter fetus subsp. testudinum 03-427]AJB44955.1 XRE family transcriptional regulator [Campylobacter fetus subsp. testudinum]ALV64293.1 transcriptional regulator, XRE family [Campylobacter fetus subsp. testudinum Sp3]AVK80571.1 XRE family transcriptional regulator [Campylobacter fetus subsp. testudinum]EAI4321599.1 helix-turn-helix transcriptional regulator [Campylobacter
MQSEFSNASDEEIAAFYRQLSQNVKRLREQSQISQLELALEIGIKSVAFYSNCENNRYGKHFNIEHIFKISKALNVDIEELFKFKS